MEKQSKIFVITGYIYIVLPVLIFLAGFCRMPIAIIGTGIILYCSFLLFKNAPKLRMPQNKKDWFSLAAGLFIIICWVYYSGIGAYSFQNLDHNCRNPIFELLVTEQWPVIQNGSQILTYYIGFWLPSALIGKIFNSIAAGYAAQFIWAVLGCFLTFYYIAAIFKKKILLTLIIFILFSGLDIVTALIIDFWSGIKSFYYFSPLSHIEWSFPGFQFSSFTTQLYWVFNQALPAWIAVLLLYHEKNNKSMIFIYSCLFLSSTLPALGLLPIVLYWGLNNQKIKYLPIPAGEGPGGDASNETKPKIFTKENLINSVKSGLSVQNILGAFFVTPVTYFYLSNNISGSNVQSLAQNAGSLPLGFLITWFLLFFMIEAGIYLVLTFKKYKSDPLYYIIWLCLVFYPFIKIGSGADFCMRASIPALVILYLYTVSLFYKENGSLKNKAAVCLVVIVLILGSFTPVHEIYRSVYMTSKGFTKTRDNLGFANFFGYTDNNFFYKHIAKRSD